MYNIKLGFYTGKKNKIDVNKDLSGISQIDNYLLTNAGAYLYFEITDNLNRNFKSTYQYNKWTDGFVLTIDVKDGKSLRILGSVRGISETHPFKEYDTILHMIFETISLADNSEHEIEREHLSLDLEELFNYFFLSVSDGDCWQKLEKRNPKWVLVSNQPLIKAWQKQGE